MGGFLAIEDSQMEVSLKVAGMCRHTARVKYSAKDGRAVRVTFVDTTEDMVSDVHAVMRTITLATKKCERFWESRALWGFMCALGNSRVLLGATRAAKKHARWIITHVSG